MDALIGSTGFVGGALSRRHGFGAAFNSQTITEARGRRFDTVVCAAAPGSMFEANRFPERDRERLQNLMDHLLTLEAETFVLISTIAVLGGGGLQADESATAFETGKAYGRHRRELEAFCAERFARCLIIRAPALFGTGLRKNFLFDILNPAPSMLNEARLQDLRAALPASLRAGLDRLYAWDESLGLFVLDRAGLEASGERPIYDAAIIESGLSAVQFTHPRSTFQYYGVANLWRDIGLGLARSLDVLHLAPPPLEAGAIFAALTQQTMPDNGAPIHHEDMWTSHPDLWGMPGPYMSDADDVLSAVKRFHAAGGRE
ncbi:hypothetical protein [Phenylobacterium sp.]|uniref:hypothetical protein n=1 Tax=Phenylobacterium sp. TaxID=1871053 RepID=UPI0027314693|nr:hypothetical protein [Phenylobacterium sp.]MDP2215360.1 hypothetical protein [Phenylobacterium sp.]